MSRSPLISPVIYINSGDASRYTFSILIPTFNNLDFLKTCIRSIQKNSSFQHQIIVAVNEGSDGTTEWLQSEGNIDFMVYRENVGICIAVNQARSLVKCDYIVYLNDDMYLLPLWDQVFADEIASYDHHLFYLSGTMIEPHDTGNPCVVLADYGRTIDTFREDDLLQHSIHLTRSDWYGATWPPSILHKKLWDATGGFSIEFSPGMYSDPDLSMKLWMLGVRHFKGCGRSLVYHFGSKTTRRIKVNKGAALFFLKWGISSGTFTSRILQRGKNFTGNALPEAMAAEPSMKSFLKKCTALFRLKALSKDSFWNRFR